MLLTIAVVVGALIFAALAGLAVIRLLDDGRVNFIWRSLRVEPTNEVFREEMVAGLPEPAKRYFLRAIKPATPLASSVELRMTGMLRSDPERPWTKMRAKEILSVPNGFVWKARASHGLLRLSGADYYAKGAGRVRFWLWRIIPAMKMEGPDTSKSAVGRLAIESIWLPSSLLPRSGAQWEEVDESSAKVTLMIDNEPTSLTLFVDRDGRLRRAVISRWGTATEDGSPAYIPFTAEVQTEREFGGYTIPARVATGWWVRSDRYFEFFRATVEHAEFR